MGKTEINENKKCPECSRVDGQMKNGSTRSGTQRIVCRHCKKSYTLEPKRNGYSEETKTWALKIDYQQVALVLFKLNRIKYAGVAQR